MKRAALMVLRAARTRPCGVVVNRDSFRELGLRGLSGFCGKVKPCSVNETA